MNLNHAVECPFIEIRNTNFDFLFCASGFEARATYLFSKMTNISDNTERYCFTFDDRHVLSRQENDFFFKKHNFKFINDESSVVTIVNTYKKIFANTKKSKINILIDYSCMTKTIYAALLKYFSLNDKHFKEVNIFFNYTPAEYIEPLDSTSNLHNHPLPLFPNVDSTDKKIVLLIGLGYEENKALGLIEYLQVNPKDVYLFYTNASNDIKYHEKVRESNSRLFKEVEGNNQFEYDLSNLTHLITIMDSLTNYLLSMDLRVIIAPMGPKTFSLVAILLAIKNRDLTVFRISAGIKAKASQKIANTSKGLCILKVTFKEQDLDLDESFDNIVQL